MCGVSNYENLCKLTTEITSYGTREVSEWWIKESGFLFVPDAERTNKTKHAFAYMENFIPNFGGEA